EVDLQTRALARWACCLRMNAAGWIPRGHWRFAQPDRGHAVTLKAILGGGRSAGIRRTRVSWQVRAEERRWLKRRAPLLHRRALRDEARVPGCARQERCRRRARASWNAQPLTGAIGRRIESPQRNVGMSSRGAKSELEQAGRHNQ